MTDAQTPFLGDWACKVMDIFLALPPEERGRYGFRSDSPNTLKSWWSQYDTSVQFTNLREPWMYEQLEEGLARKGLDLDPHHFAEAIGNAETIEDMLALPTIAPDPKPKAKGYGPIAVATGTEQNPNWSWMSYTNPPDQPKHRQPTKSQGWTDGYGGWLELYQKRQRKRYDYASGDLTGHDLPTSGARKLGVMLLDFVLRYNVSILVYVGAGSEAGKTTASDMALGLLRATTVETVYLIDPHLQVIDRLPQSVIQLREEASPKLMRKIVKMHNGHRRVGLFSDIRTLTEGEVTDKNVRSDMELQYKLWQAMERPDGVTGEKLDVAGCLKHRALYEDENEFLVPSVGAHVVIQPWTRAITTEVRIHAAALPEVAPWNSEKHEQVMLYYCCSRLGDSFGFADTKVGHCVCNGTWTEHASTCVFGDGCGCAFCLQERVYMYEHLDKISPHEFQKILDQACRPIAAITARTKADNVPERDSKQQKKSDASNSPPNKVSRRGKGGKKKGATAKRAPVPPRNKKKGNQGSAQPPATKPAPPEPSERDGTQRSKAPDRHEADTTASGEESKK